MRRYDKAIADLDLAVQLDPAYAFAYIHRGLTWSDQEEYDKAIADYNVAIKLDARALPHTGTAATHG